MDVLLLCASGSFLDYVRIIRPYHIFTQSLSEPACCHSPWSQCQTTSTPLTSSSYPFTHTIASSRSLLVQSIRRKVYGQTSLPHNQLPVLTTLKARQVHLLRISPASQGDRDHSYREQKSQTASLVCCICTTPMDPQLSVHIPSTDTYRSDTASGPRDS